MFDISVDRNVKKATEKISEIMYSIFLRELDYAQDFDIAELEIELEGEGKFLVFCKLLSFSCLIITKGFCYFLSLL